MILPPALEQLTASPAVILVTAALLEAVLPWPAQFRPSAIVAPLTRFGRKACRSTGSPLQQVQTGLLAMLVVWLPCATLLWAARSLTLFESLFDLLFLLLMIESRPLRELAKATRNAVREKRLALACQQAAPWLKRETEPLSLLGLLKAVGEGCVLRLVGQWAGPLLGFALLGVQGALLWRLVQLMNQGWNPKQSEFVHFGQPAAALYQALHAPVILLLALPLCLSQLHHLAARVRLARHWPYPAMGCLLGLLAHSLGNRLGGPRYYQGRLVRLPVFEASAEPDANLPQRLLQRLLLIGWGWLVLGLLLTVLL